MDLMAGEGNEDATMMVVPEGGVDGGGKGVVGLVSDRNRPCMPVGSFGK